MKIYRLTLVEGQTFCRLAFLRDAPSRKGARRVVCRCECGTERECDLRDLRRGRTTSCGCYMREVAATLVVKLPSTNHAHDLTGLRSGALVALERISTDRDGKAMWLCRCDCGAEKTVRARALVAGLTVSCGCSAGMGLSSERARRKYRVDAQRRRGRRVAADGNFTEEEVDALYALQRGRCSGFGCSAKLGTDLHRDHIKPLSRGGSNSVRNIQLLCEPCNLRKAAKDPITWAQEFGMLV